MTQQIKQRIEQIRRGEVPEGYKKTNVGIVPAEWEITRFKKKFDRLMRKNTEGNSNVLTISAQFGLVNQEEFFNKSVASDDKSNYYLLHRGEYTYNKSYSNGYPFGAIKRLDKYDKGVVSPLYICFSANEGNKCPEFYLQYFEAGKLNSEIHAFAQEGARNHGLLNISVEDFFNSILIEPSLSEQKKIAEILKTQDRVIELYEKRIDQLKKLKRVFLQKMFPKPSATVPEWRFPEFTDDWEQRKFSDFVQRESAFRVSSSEYPSVEYEDVVAEEGRLNKDVRKKETQKTGIIFDGTQVLYGKLRPYLHNWLNPDFSGIAVGDWWVLRPVGVDKKFLYRLIQTQQFDEVANQSSGSKMPRADWNHVSNTEFTIPSSLDEQRQVAETFDDLDNLITLHQRKCDEEKQKKKALMQLLLSGIVRV